MHAGPADLVGQGACGGTRWLGRRARLVLCRVRTARVRLAVAGGADGLGEAGGVVIDTSIRQNFMLFRCEVERFT